MTGPAQERARGLPLIDAVVLADERIAQHGGDRHDPIATFDALTFALVDLHAAVRDADTLAEALARLVMRVEAQGGNTKHVLRVLQHTRALLASRAAEQEQATCQCGQKIETCAAPYCLGAGDEEPLRDR